MKPLQKRKKLADVKLIKYRLLGYEGTKIYRLLLLEGHIICLSNLYINKNPIVLKRKDTPQKQAKTVTFEVEFPLKAASVEDPTAREAANKSYLASIRPSTSSVEEAAQEIKH
jgi:hypothetical protein